MSAASALERANEVRLAGAQVRRELAALDWRQSRIRAAELLRDPCDGVAAMRLTHFLVAIRRVGSMEATQVIARAGLCRGTWDWRIGPYDWRRSTEVRTLTERQRLALAEALEC